MVPGGVGGGGRAGVAVKYAEVSLGQLCAYLRRADAIVHELKESGSELRLAEAEDGVWPLNDFAEFASSFCGQMPITPGETSYFEFMFPTDRTVLVRSVACEGAHISVLESPDNNRYVTQIADSAPGLWLPVRPRDEFAFSLRNDGDEPIDVKKRLSVLAYVLEGVRP